LQADPGKFASMLRHKSSAQVEKLNLCLLRPSALKIKWRSV